MGVDMDLAYTLLLVVFLITQYINYKTHEEGRKSIKMMYDILDSHRNAILELSAKLEVQHSIIFSAVKQIKSIEIETKSSNRKYKGNVVNFTRRDDDGDSVS